MTRSKLQYWYWDEVPCLYSPSLISKHKMDQENKYNPSLPSSQYSRNDASSVLDSWLTWLIPLSLVFVLRQWLHPSSLTPALTNGSESPEPESHIRHRLNGPVITTLRMQLTRSGEPESGSPWLDEFPKYFPRTITKFCWLCGLIFIFTYIYSDTATREYENITAKPLW